MNAKQDYPHMSEWPIELGLAPTEDHLIQAYALLSTRPRARPKRSRRALAVAAYLSGQRWWPDDLGRAIDHAMGTPEGARNDPRNVINEQREGLQHLGLVTLHKHRDGPRETWSCTLTSEGEAAVKAYCAAQGIRNPLEAAPRDEEDLMDQVELLQHSQEGRRVLREHLIRERKPALIAQFKSLLSSFSCCVCCFNFEDRYGPIGHAFIEAHHLEPISLRKEGSRTGVRDLIPVCSNCHRMIHTRTPPYTPEEIKDLMSQARRRRRQQ